MDLVPYKATKYNFAVNKFSTFDEIIIYNDKHTILSGNFGGVDVVTGECTGTVFADRSRKWQCIGGELVAVEGKNPTLYDLERTISNSRSRALDTFFGFALCNKWQYFITLTFSPDKVNRDDESAVKYAWKCFRQKLQRIDSNVTILAVAERHPTSGKLHMHALVGCFDFKPYITRATNPHTNKPIFSNGRSVYNIDLFEYGFSTLVNIDKDSQLQVVNYVTKYIIKDFGTLGFGKKSFWHTNNLEYKDKLYYDMSQEDINNFVSCNKSNLYKSNKDFMVFRVGK